MSRIYLASSWRNPKQPELVTWLRDCGHDVYDFRNPPTCSGFGWSEIDPNWQQWDINQYINALSTAVANRGFHADYDGMEWADTCVLLLPCGRSAHIEAGYMAGRGKNVGILIEDCAFEPELMYKLANVFKSRYDLARYLKVCST